MTDERDAGVQQSLWINLELIFAAVLRQKTIHATFTYTLIFSTSSVFGPFIFLPFLPFEFLLFDFLLFDFLLFDFLPFDFLPFYFSALLFLLPYDFLPFGFLPFDFLPYAVLPWMVAEAHTRKGIRHTIILKSDAQFCVC